MKRAARVLGVIVAMTLVWIALPRAAHAHLMVAQRGTVNFVRDGAYAVVSIPVSAFVGVDDDGDGRLGAEELRAHDLDLKRQIASGFQLSDASGPRPLQGLLLNVSPDHTSPGEPVDHVVALGRFALASPDAPVTLTTSLFGTLESERTLYIRTRRGSDVHLAVLSPEHPERALFPSGPAVFASFARLGVEHIFGGLDHLLFLLVVLATGWGWRHVLLGLTCFTAGHAVTLTASVLGGVHVAPAIVEPAIALTIVAMAAFDWHARARGRTHHPALRLGLVFACALVHGLGLASSLTDLGLDASSQLASLAGFNFGIELGQGLVALGAGVLVVGLRKLGGDCGLERARRATAVLAILVGTGWFVERVVDAERVALPGRGEISQAPAT